MLLVGFGHDFIVLLRMLKVFGVVQVFGAVDLKIRVVLAELNCESKESRDKMLSRVCSLARRLVYVLECNLLL